MINPIFTNKYNEDAFVEFIQGIIPSLSFDKKRSEIRTGFKSIQQIAEVSGNNLDLVIFVAKLGSSLHARVEITKNTYAVLKSHARSNALVVYVSDDSSEWRLSLVTTKVTRTKDGIKESVSNPRRFSYVLGPNAKVATPSKMLQGITDSIADLENKFSLEVVTNEFFDNYKQLFDKLFLYLKDDIKFNFFADDNKIKIEDFAKKLLGQIVFIYFLQKKGWLGAKKEDHIHEGNHIFLRSLYDKCESDNKNFFNDTLEYLFYDAFNREPEKAGSFYREYFDCQIPFLNGGLFEPLNKYDWKKCFLHISNELFSNKEKTGILDIFDLYNFTIDENTADDQEVSVDPEMLGKVFEKLLDTNKKTGSFYTPREVVSYMVKQSLVEYIKTKTNIDGNNIEKLFSNYQIEENDLNKKEYKKIEEALTEIKIIDPAVGSGAFPVGILQEITRIRLICQSKILIKPKLAYDIKKEILENNIYGVDIDHGAIDIARLRFWLSLVVDADLSDVEPLPNLDFKLVAANTLLGLNSGQYGLWDESDLFDQMNKLREKYFRARTKFSKEKIQNDFEKLIKKSNNLLATERQRQIATYNPFSTSTIAQFFDSEFMFGVKKFDIVIGNPPYIGQKGNKNLFDAMKDDINFEKKMDYWYFFLHKAYDITKKDGITTFITPNYWITTQGGKKIRKKLVNDYQFIEYINFNENSIFVAGVHTNVFILKKEKIPNNLIKCVIYKNVYKNNFLDKKDQELNFIVNQDDILNNWTGFVHFLPDNILKIINKLYTNCEKLSDNDTKGIAKKGIRAGKKINNGICNINQGVITGKDKFVDKKNNSSYGVFILNQKELSLLNLNNEEKTFIKNFYKNSDIKQYYTASHSKYYFIYVNNIESENKLKEFPNLYRHLLEYKDLLMKRSINGILESAYNKGKWWALTTDRPNIDFKGEKIICPQRSAINTFGYSDSEWYASADVYYITLNKEMYSLKYILAILNSKIAYFWLYYMGKRKGEALELYLEPLQFIPIKKKSEAEQKPFIEIVDKILEITKSSDYIDNLAKKEEVKEYEKRIDQLVYKLYDLTPEEIKIVEGKN